MGGRVKPLHPANINPGPKSLKPSGDTVAIKKQLKIDFLNHFKNGGALYYAAAKIGRSADTIEVWRKEDAAFDEAVCEADKHVTDTLVLTAYTRALQGKSKSADALLMFLIKGREPKYRDHFNMDARMLHAGVIGATSKVPEEIRALLSGMTKEALKAISEKL